MWVEVRFQPQWHKKWIDAFVTNHFERLTDDMNINQSILITLYQCFVMCPLSLIQIYNVPFIIDDAQRLVTHRSTIDRQGLRNFG